MNALAQLKPEGINKHEAAWDQLVANMPGRSMVVFLSDFWRQKNSTRKTSLCPILEI